LRASFLAFFALIFYYDLFGPDVPGLSFGPTFENRKGQMVVLSPPMNPAFERARAKTGDYVVSVDGQEVYTDSDWLAVAANLEVGRPVRLGIERGARHFEVQTTFERNQILGSLFRASFLPTEASRFLMLVVSLFIAFSRPYNLSARPGRAHSGSSSSQSAMLSAVRGCSRMAAPFRAGRSALVGSVYQ